MQKPHYRRTADGRTVFLGDGLQNALANINTPRDKATGSVYRFLRHNDAELAAAYRSAWLPRKIVDIPAQDATRRWRAWNADKAEISAIEIEETRLGLQRAVRDCMISSRLLGGAAIYIGTGESNVSKPLNVDRIGVGGVRHLTVIPRTILTAGDIDTDPESPWFGKPAFYKLGKGTGQQVEIHPSRLAIMHGAPIPAGADAFASDGWGDSVLQCSIQAIKQADGVSASAASLMFEANVDVLHLPKLMTMLDEPGGENAVTRYLSILATNKGINGMLVLDGGATVDGKTSNKTEYERKGASFAGIGDVWDRFMQAVSGAADIPATRLFGQAPTGMNSTGESDLQNYAQRVAAMQSMEIGPALAVLDECLIRSALGSRPPEVYYEWRSIWETTAKERAEIGKATAEIVGALAGTNLFPIPTLQQAAANAMIETGSLPGLEGAVDEFGLELDEPDEADDLAAMGEPQESRIKSRANDAAPRSLYVHRRVENAGDLIAWAKSQGFKTTLPADDMHVTVAYSRVPVDWMAAGEAWDEKVEIAPGGPRLIDQFGEARVLLFASSSLKWRHDQFKEVGASWDHPEYQPHITISYDPDSPDLTNVEPYKGKIVLGPEVFSEVEEDWSDKIKES